MYDTAMASAHNVNGEQVVSATDANMTKGRSTSVSGTFDGLRWIWSMRERSCVLKRKSRYFLQNSHEQHGPEERE